MVDMFQIILLIIMSTALIEVLFKVSKRDVDIKRKGDFDYKEMIFLKRQLNHLKNKKYE